MATLNKVYEIIVQKEDTGKRLDRFLSEQMPDVSRSQIQRWLQVGAIVYNKNVPSADYKVKALDVFIITPPPVIDAIPMAQPMVLDIVYEDKDLVVINKPSGMVVHPAPGHLDNTLVNALLAHCGDSLSGIGGVKRPGIVHRLDKDTSGLMVVAKHDLAHQGLSKQFAHHKTIQRSYMAYVWGVPYPVIGSVVAPMARHLRNRQMMAVSKALSAKKAVTHYKFLKKWGVSNNERVSKIECILETGRTHQIRVHCKHIGHSLIGDTTYGKRNLSKNIPEFLRAFPRQALHAYGLALLHPINQEPLRFEVPLPLDLLDLERSLECINQE